MMDRLRESATGLGMKIILGLIILSFMIGGVSSYLIGGGNNTAVKVNGKEITIQQFEQAYTNEKSRLQQQFGEFFFQLAADPQFDQGIRNNALNQLINNELMTQYSDELGLYISDKQLSDVIHSIPAFQNNGTFSQQAFEDSVRINYGMTSNQFAKALRTSMLSEQLSIFLSQTEFVVDSDIQIEANLSAQTREIQTATIDINDYIEQMEVSDDEINAYYQTQQQQFTHPEQMKISYLELSAPALTNSVSVTEKELEEYYQAHQNQYSTKEAHSFSHILITDKAKAEAALERVKAGEDFAALASELSEDTGTAPNGGDLGWVEQGMLEPAFDQAAFALTEKGQLSDLVESSVGYHIIQLNDLKAAQTKSFAEVKNEIETILLGDKAASEFYRLQSDFKNKAFDFPDSLQETADAIGGTVKSTEFVSLDTLPELLDTADIRDALMTQDVIEGYNSEVIEIAAEHDIVVRIDEMKEAYVSSLEDVKEQIRETLAVEKARTKVDELATQLVSSLENGDESVLAEQNLSFSEATVVDRQNHLNIFNLAHPTEGKSTYGKRNDENNNVVIVKLNKVIDSDTAETSTEEIKMQQQNKLLNQTNMALLNALREDATIKYYIQ